MRATATGAAIAAVSGVPLERLAAVTPGTTCPSNAAEISRACATIASSPAVAPSPSVTARTTDTPQTTVTPTSSVTAQQASSTTVTTTASKQTGTAMSTYTNAAGSTTNTTTCASYRGVPTVTSTPAAIPPSVPTTAAIKSVAAGALELASVSAIAGRDSRTALGVVAKPVATENSGIRMGCSTVMKQLRSTGPRLPLDLRNHPRCVSTVWCRFLDGPQQASHPVLRVSNTSGFSRRRAVNRRLRRTRSHRDLCPGPRHARTSRCVRIDRADCAEEKHRPHKSDRGTGRTALGLANLSHQRPLRTVHVAT